MTVCKHRGMRKHLDAGKGPCRCLASTCPPPWRLTPYHAGSADGSARVWDVQTRQPLRTLPNPAKGPLTAVLVVDRPPFLAPGATSNVAVGPCQQATS